ncbi:hypothetical protein ACHAWF_014439 [Thalassiosira exigua]
MIVSRHCCTKYRPLVQLALSSLSILLVRATQSSPVPAFIFPALVDRGGASHHRYSSGGSLKMGLSGHVLESPSAERNKGPINDHILSPTVFPRIKTNASDRDKIYALELAAGCGVHTTHFVASFLSSTYGKDFGIEWHPSDPDPEARSSIDARVKIAKLEDSILPANSWLLGEGGGTSCGEPSRDKGDSGAILGSNKGDDAAYSQYHDYFDLVLCINMIHISPWEATIGLMNCAGKVLRKGGVLVCYGPYKVGGTAVQSNLQFDAALRSRNPEWGVRNLEDVIAIAEKDGLEFLEKVEMPANNLSVLFRKR